MDSRKLEHIRLMKIDDSINNNHTFPFSLEIKSENGVLEESKLLNSNCTVSCSRRKQYATKVPSSLREFFRTHLEENPEPTVVDKLISKNRYALIERQMSKLKQKSASTVQKPSSAKPGATSNKNRSARKESTVRGEYIRKCTRRKQTNNDNDLQKRRKRCCTKKASPVRKKQNAAKNDEPTNSKNKKQDQTKKTKVAVKTTDRNTKPSRNEKLPQTGAANGGDNKISKNVRRYYTRSGTKSIRKFKIAQKKQLTKAKHISKAKAKKPDNEKSSSAKKTDNDEKIVSAKKPDNEKISSAKKTDNDEKIVSAKKPDSEKISSAKKTDNDEKIVSAKKPDNDEKIIPTKKNSTVPFLLPDENIECKSDKKTSNKRKRNSLESESVSSPNASNICENRKSSVNGSTTDKKVTAADTKKCSLGDAGTTPASKRRKIENSDCSLNDKNIDAIVAIPSVTDSCDAENSVNITVKEDIVDVTKTVSDTTFENAVESTSLRNELTQSETSSSPDSQLPPSDSLSSEDDTTNKEILNSSVNDNAEDNNNGTRLNCNDEICENLENEHCTPEKVTVEDGDNTRIDSVQKDEVTLSTKEQESHEECAEIKPLETNDGTEQKLTDNEISSPLPSCTITLTDIIANGSVVEDGNVEKVEHSISTSEGVGSDEIVTSNKTDDDVFCQFSSEISTTNSANEKMSTDKSDTGDEKLEVKENVDEGEEIRDNAIKETILNALGLQSLDKVNSSERSKSADKNNYTGTLKAIIKLHRTSDNDKGYRKMEMKQSNDSSIQLNSQSENGLDNAEKYKINGTSGIISPTYCATESANSVSFTQTNMGDNKFTDLDTSAVGHLSQFLSKINCSSVKEKNKGSASLVVPEKSSSFSIHPNRLCSDVCKYCFGKFGSLDTPCHVAQLKDPERQKKILSCEPNLKIDTCLCDACFRFVDKKVNNKKRKVIGKSTLSQSPCSVKGCSQPVRHYIKRKWLLRLKRRIQKISFNFSKTGHSMYHGLCSQHYYLVDFYSVCCICKKRLNRTHMYSVGSELSSLNKLLMQDNIPVKLTENGLVCKVCRYYMSIRLKYRKSSQVPDEQKIAYQNFHKRLMRKYNIQIKDLKSNENRSIMEMNGSAIIADTIMISDDEIISSSSTTSDANEEKNPGSLTAVGNVAASANTGANNGTGSNGNGEVGTGKEEKKEARKSYPMGFTNIATLLNPLENELTGDIRRDSTNNGTRIQVKFGNLNIGKLSNLNIGQGGDTRTGTETARHAMEQQIGNSSQTKEELPLTANFDFDVTANQNNKNWEKCVSTLQFDKKTKRLFQDLQKPYGNQSSFMRHLIMLEKYWRLGYFNLSDVASPAAIKYINGVKNRINSLETATFPLLENNKIANNSSASPNEIRFGGQIKIVTTSSGVKNDTTAVTAVSSVISTATNSNSHGGNNINKNNVINVIRSNPPALMKVSTMPSNHFTMLKGASATSGSSIYTINPSELKTIKDFTGSNNNNNNNNNNNSNNKSSSLCKHIYVNTSKIRNLIPIAPKPSQQQQQYQHQQHLKQHVAPNIVLSADTTAYPISSSAATCKSNLPSKKPMSVIVSSTRGNNAGTATFIPLIKCTTNSSVTVTADGGSRTVIPKLPKTLTVTQIDDTVNSSRSPVADQRNPSATANSMEEKPSISVFREVIQ